MTIEKEIIDIPNAEITSLVTILHLIQKPRNLKRGISFFFVFVTPMLTLWGGGHFDGHQ